MPNFSRYTWSNLGFSGAIFFLLFLHYSQMETISLSKIQGENAVEYVHLQKGELINYYQLKQQKPLSKFRAHYLEIQNDAVYHFIDPVSHYWTNTKGDTDEKNLPIEVSSRRGTLIKTKELLQLSDSVELKQGEQTMSCQNASYRNWDSVFECETNVHTHMVDLKTRDKINAVSDVSTFNTKSNDAELRGSVSGEILRPRSYEPPTLFKAAKINYRAQESKVYLEDEVEVKRQTFFIKSRKGSIVLDNYGPKRPNYFTFENDVTLNQKIPDQPDRNAYGEKLEGFLPENYVILTGAPRVEQGKDVTRGNRIILYEKTSMMEVEDAVTSVIYDPQKWKKSENGPMKQEKK